MQQPIPLGQHNSFPLTHGRDGSGTLSQGEAMPDHFGPHGAQGKGRRLADIFAEVESLVQNVSTDEAIMQFVPAKYQLYVAVAAASLGTIGSIAHLFTHPDAIQVAQAVAADASGADASGAGTAPVASVSPLPQSGESTPVASEPHTNSEEGSNLSPADYAAAQAELAAKVPLPDAP